MLHLEIKNIYIFIYLAALDLSCDIQAQLLHNMES